MDTCSYTKLKSTDIENYDTESVYPTKPSLQTRVIKKPRRSCLKTCLCVTLVLVGLLASAMLVAGVFAYKWMANQVQDWTVTEPLHLPVVDIPKMELRVFKDNAKLFFDLIQAGRDPGDFAVTATNVNGLAASSDVLRGNSYTEIATNEVTVSLSLPMDGFPGGKGRFLVGTETLSWDPDTSVLRAKMTSPDETSKIFYDFQFHLGLVDDGKWNLMILSGQIFDWTMPQECIDAHKNILEDLYNCDNNDEDCKQLRRFIEGIDDIVLQKDQVVFYGHHSEQYEDTVGDRRVLSEKNSEEQSLNYKPSWKLHLVRRLVAI